jgi:ubiquinone/menaquinone biosynthesis C-methylase UbiE
MSAQHAGAFWDRIAERYSKQPIADEAAYQKKLGVTREYFRPDMRVLELGCGTGSTAILHAPYVGHIRAIDVSSKMLEIAQAKADADGIENVSFERATIDEFTAPEQTLDAVLALSILHLLEDRKAVIEKVYRLLRPGGIFVSSTTCAGRSLKYQPLRLILPIARLFGRAPLVRFFSPRQLEDDLTAAGFAIDYRWQAAPGKAVFIVAKKPG